MSHNYFYSDFSKDFSAWSDQRYKVNCVHHSIPQKLAYFVDGYSNRYLWVPFYFSWFGITVTEQVLYRYFPHHHLEWKIRFGEFPIPMRGAGLGCIKWDNPIWLLEEFVHFEEESFKFFLNLWGNYIESKLSKIELDRKQFVSKIIHNRHFVERKSIFAISFLDNLNRI